MNKNLRWSILFLTITQFNIYAQKSGTYDLATQHSIDIYHNNTEDQAILYNGKKYFPLLRHRFDVGHPNYKYENFELGFINYNGVIYKDIPILYDIHQDVIAIEHYLTSSASLIQKEKIIEFWLGDDYFVKIPVDSTISNNQPGLYRMVYNGQTKFLVKDEKEKITKLTEGREIIEYKDRSKYFLSTESIFLAIKNKKNLMDAMGDQKKVVNKHLKNSGLSYNRNKEKTIAVAASYFDSISPSL